MAFDRPIGGVSWTGSHFPGSFLPTLRASEAYCEYDFRPNLKEAYRIFCLTEIPFLISLERWLDNIRVQKTFYVKALIKKNFINP